MKKNILCHVMANLLLIQCIASGPSRAWAQSTDTFALKKDDANQKTGSIYYSGNHKNELVFRTNIWGAVQFPGVHYLPVGTHFLEAISIAGGPLNSADTTEVLLSTKEDGPSGGKKVISISLVNSLSHEQENPLLKPDDIILIKADRTYEKTQLWLNIGTFVLSAAALGLLIEQNNRLK